MYDIDEALMILREHERFTDDEFKDAVSELMELIARKLELDYDFRFR